MFNLKVKTEIKNIDELHELLKQLEIIIDKINNFEFEIETSLCK